MSASDYDFLAATELAAARRISGIDDWLKNKLPFAKIWPQQAYFLPESNQWPPRPWLSLRTAGLYLS